MYAIVKIAGQQFKVEEKQELFVHRLEGKEDTKVSFDDVLLLGNNGKISVGDPVIKGAKVSAKILEHLKGDKVIVFKKKRRKGYSVNNAHRQYLTKISIEKIYASGEKEKVVSKETTVKKEEVKAETSRQSAVDNRKKQETRNRKPATRNKKPATRNQKPETRNKKQ